LLYTVWPGRGGMRYVMPMMPLYLYFMYQGVLQITACGLARKLRIFGAALLLASLLAESGYFAHANLQNDRRMDGPYDSDSTEMFGFVKTHAAKNARLLFFKPRAMRLLTGRAAFASDRFEDLAKVDYVVIQKMFDRSNQIQLPAEAAVEWVFENESFVVYRVRGAGTPKNSFSVRGVRRTLNEGPVLITSFPA